MINKHEPHFHAWESEMRDGEPPQWSLRQGRVIGRQYAQDHADQFVAQH